RYTLLHTLSYFFFLTAPATPYIYTLSLHDALPILRDPSPSDAAQDDIVRHFNPLHSQFPHARDCSQSKPYEETRSNDSAMVGPRSEEHTSELQSPCNLVCRLLLEKKNKKVILINIY